MKKFENLYFKKASKRLALQFFVFCRYRKIGRLTEAPKLRQEHLDFINQQGVANLRVKPFAGTVAYATRSGRVPKRVRDRERNIRLLLSSTV